MRTLSAKKLSLDKARDLGIIEEPVTIGDCELVLRNLRPDHYESALGDCAELDELAYLNAFMIAHVCRSICQINGVDLRDVDYIEDEEIDPKTGKTKTVKVERHDYLRNNIVNSWSKEALYVVYRKLGDVNAEAEKKARDGIQFRIAEESPDEKYRRLLGDVKEVEQELPPELVERILEDAGYMLRRNVDIARLEEAAKQGEAQSPVETPTPVTAPETATPSPATPSSDGRTIAVTTTDPLKLMRERVPLHQAPAPRAPAAAVAPPAPVYHPAPVAQAPTQDAYEIDPATGFRVDSTGRRVQPDGSVPIPAAVPVAGGPIDPNSRTARLAREMEEEMGYGTNPLLAGSSMVPGTPQAAFVTGGNAPPDPKTVKAVIDSAPVAGINPRYRPHGQ